MTVLASDLINQVRGSLEDWGNSITSTFVLTANDPSGTIYQLPTNPISSSTLPILTDNTTVKTYGTDFTVNYNNSQLTVNYVQTSGHTLTLQYVTVLYRDERILQAIQQGARRLYPRVYKRDELYISCAYNQFNYDLTSTTDVPTASSFATGIVPSEYDAATARGDLAKVQSRIHTAEYLPFGYVTTTSWMPFINFSRTSQSNWETDTAFNTGDTIKLMYSAPCTPPLTVDSPVDVPDAYSDLPVWYALGVLLGRKESVRDRSDSYQTSNSVNANAAGLQAKTGLSDYMGLFLSTLRDTPMRPLATSQRARVPAYARGYPWR